MSAKIKRSRVPQAYPRKPYKTHEIVGDPATDHLVTADLANVPLPCGNIAVCSLDVFNDLMDQGMSDQWFLRWNGRGKGYVQVRHPEHPDRMFTVARLIAGDHQGLQVRYKDRNPLNLRLANLVLTTPGVRAVA